MVENRDQFPVTEFTENVLPIVREAASMALKLQEDRMQIDNKADGSPVSQVDRAIETFLHDRLERVYPADGFRGEEETSRTSTSGRVWIVDPIDGTIQFIRGQEFWSILVALDDKQDHGKLGILAFPARDEIIYAEDGNGCWEITPEGTKKLHVSDTTKISDAYVLHNGIEFARRAKRAGQLTRLLTNVYAERGYADAFGHMEVIRGHADIMIDFLTEYHDIAAVRVAAEEAGGMWTALDGGQQLANPPTGSVTSNRLLHQIAVDSLALNE